MHSFVRIAIFIVLLAPFQNRAQVMIAQSPSPIEFDNGYEFDAAIEKKLEGNNQMGRFQAFLDYSNKGDFRKAQQIDDRTRDMPNHTPLTPEVKDSIFSNHTIADARAFIIEQAKQHQITIINEAHHNPMHRFFTRSLLKDLYDAGYTHLGLEALYNGPVGGTQMASGARIMDEKDSVLNLRGYPVRSSGSYTQEPQMGNLIREAIALGFVVFAYEKSGVGSGHPREIGQAQNIKAVLDENPGAKILIHCGFAHAYEGGVPSWGKAMAGHLKDITGIDPLTINQVKYSEHSSPEYNDPLYNLLEIQNSSVLIHSSGKAMGFQQGEAYTDIAVFHPRTEYISDRPSWLLYDGVKKLSLSSIDIAPKMPSMIFAFKHGENIDTAIPIDLVEVENDNNEFLILKPGKYTLVVVNIEDDAIKFDISV